MCREPTMTSLANSLGIFTVLVFLVVVDGSRSSDPTVMMYQQDSPENVQGCYHQNESLALCFDIRASFVELKNSDNNTLVRFRVLSNEMFFFQILDDVFVGYRSSKIPMHLQYLPVKHSALHDHDWKRMYDSEHNPNMTTPDGFAAKLNSALRRLQDIREITLLHDLSIALRENASNHVITMRFHMLCMTLLPENSHRETVVPKSRWIKKMVSEPTEDKAGGSTELKEAGKNSFRSKRSDYCRDLRYNPHHNDCLGMCGPGCSCWSFVCGNCCYNQLCFEHDKCCRHDMWTVSCLLPFVHYLSCENGYGGYPSCLT